MGLDPNHQMTERDIHYYELPDEIGDNWRDLARALGYKEAKIKSIEKEKGNSNKECCIELLVRWLHKKGKDATAGKLAEALIGIEIKSAADRLIKPNDQSQIDRFERTIREMNEKLISLRDEGSKMSARNKELEEKVAKTSARNKELEEEVSKISARNKELEEENSKLRKGKKELEDVKQHGKGDLKNAVLFDKNDACVVWTDTDRAERELHISEMLGNLKRQLSTYVTSLLEVPEINQDQLKTPVRLDILTRLSKRLQELYTDIQTMVPQACRCSEDLKKEFYDFVYHGLRAEHNELVHRVQDLESALEEMSEEEKENFCQLKKYQVNRKRQVERLDNVWRSLFSPPECLPKTPLSDISGTSGKSNESQKVSRHSDPGDRPKETKSKDKRVEFEAPSANYDGDNYEVCLNVTTEKSAKGIFRKKKKKDENACTLVSCSLRRDS